MNETTTDLAEDRTDWAEDRTILANERTFAGWLRTGMACIALALGLRVIFGDTDMGWHPGRLAASLFCTIAILIFAGARRRCGKTLARLSHHQARPIRTTEMTVLAVLLSLGALATLALLWII